MPNYRKINLKRKVFVRGKKQNFKRFKKTPQFVKDNPENKIAREKERDAYHFTDSEEETDDLGMGLDISDLPFLDDNHADKQKLLIALTQDSVRPLFTDDEASDELKLEEGLAELRHSSFRPNQKETIKRILQGRSTLFISPTGSGKSLCYQLPALLYYRYRKYITIVVSPLISLMEDQMLNFPSCIKAVCLHSGNTAMQRRRSIEQLVNGEAQVVFISPEAIVSGLLSLDDLKNLPPVGFVCIDEAHCLSGWSHNFRPAYLQFFKVLREQMNIKTYLGLTATATKATSFAIARNLIINPETDVIGSTTIPENLILSVSYENVKERALIKLLKSPTFRIMKSIIVYCNRREETDFVASRIRTAMQDYSTLIETPERKKSSSTSNRDSDQSIDSNSSSDKESMKLTWHAESYHAGLTTESRRNIQRRFIKGEIRVVVATIAFGMGINKANVRAIIHYDMPTSFESYVQEIGRAGRDGKPAQCHMFLKADKTDIYYQQRNVYASVTEQANLMHLTDYLFEPCRCPALLKPAELEILRKRNQADPHKISSHFKTSFTDTVAHDSDDNLSDDEICNDENKSVEKENSPIKYIRKSIVKKHRTCKGHEIAFGFDEAIDKLNLKSESIITLICQLQQAYPQLKIEQHIPTKSNCTLFCYRGPAQMESLSKTSRPVGIALRQYKEDQIKKNGCEGEMPNRITFDVIKVARKLGLPSADVIRMLKKTEWELVEKTGSFRRSQVKIKFETISFHLTAVGDLDEDEKREINRFLYDSVRSYEKTEREKVSKMFNILKRHSIDMAKMTDKSIRLETSNQLKLALNAYFDPSLEPQVRAKRGESSAQLNEANTIDVPGTLSKEKEASIRKHARAFIDSNHGKNFSPRTIARIFQGISTPNYPAEVWGLNKRWWRIHIDVDFLQLTAIIQECKLL